MPGPPKKPIELRVLEGSLIPSVHGRIEDAVKFSKPDESIEPPDFLDSYGLQFWNNHYSELVRSGVLQSTDLDSFGYLCWLVQKVRWADEQCEAVNWIEESDKGLTRRPALAVQRADWVRELIQFKTRFGMFPSHRNELQVDKQKTGIKTRKRG